MVWNIENETKALMALVDEMANMLNGSKPGNPYTQEMKINRAIWEALNRARNTGFESGRRFEKGG